MTSAVLFPVSRPAACLLLLALLAGGCRNPLVGIGAHNRVAGTRSSSPPRADTPEGTFRAIWQACIDGRFADAHALYSRRLQRVIPLRQIATTYGQPGSREEARRLLAGARFRLNHYAGRHAFATVRWPDGRDQPLTFVREGDHWRLDITPVRR